MATAREIACLYGNPDQIDDLERAILRHMERLMFESAKVERDRCAKIATECLNARRAHRNVSEDETSLATWIAASILENKVKE